MRLFKVLFLVGSSNTVYRRLSVQYYIKSLGFGRGSRVEGTKSRVEGNMSRVLKNEIKSYK